MGSSTVMLEENTWGGGNKTRSWNTPKNFYRFFFLSLHRTFW